MNLNTLIFYLASICAVILVLVPHEYAHAYVAYKNGDGTAKAMGRLTLNPLKHIDPIGFITCALVGFGWAKPVPIYPANFRNYKRGMFTTAIAGITVNYVIAFFVYLIYVLLKRFVFGLIKNATYLVLFLDSLLICTFSYSLCSVVFNLLPLYPLDGFRVIEALTRQVNPVRRFLREYGNAILIIIIVESFICNLLVRYGVAWAESFNILNYVISFATDIIGYPITAAWGWILKI